MLNETQLDAYKKTRSVILSKLDDYADKISELASPIRRQSALNAFYFTLEQTLTLDKKSKKLRRKKTISSHEQLYIDAGVAHSKKNLELACRHIYPARNHKMIRSFFSLLHDFIYANNTSHILIKSILDPDEQSKTRMSDHHLKARIEIGLKLKLDCIQWLWKEHKKKKFKQKILLVVKNRLLGDGVISEFKSQSIKPEPMMPAKKGRKIKSRNKWASF